MRKKGWTRESFLLSALFDRGSTVFPVIRSRSHDAGLVALHLFPAVRSRHSIRHSSFFLIKICHYLYFSSIFFSFILFFFYSLVNYLFYPSSNRLHPFLVNQHPTEASEPGPWGHFPERAQARPAPPPPSTPPIPPPVGRRVPVAPPPSSPPVLAPVSRRASPKLPSDPPPRSAATSPPCLPYRAASEAVPASPRAPRQARPPAGRRVFGLAPSSPTVPSIYKCTLKLKYHDSDSD